MVMKERPYVTAPEGAYDYLMRLLRLLVNLFE